MIASRPLCVCPSGHPKRARSFGYPRCVGCSMAGCTRHFAAPTCPGLKARRRTGEKPSPIRERTERVQFNALVRKQVYELCGSRCLSCGTSENIEIDHVMPVSLGGSNDLDNLQPLCHRCNSKKAGRYIDFRGPNASGEAVLVPARQRRVESLRKAGA